GQSPVISSIPAQLHPTASRPASLPPSDLVAPSTSHLLQVQNFDRDNEAPLVLFKQITDYDTPFFSDFSELYINHLKDDLKFTSKECPRYASRKFSLGCFYIEVGKYSEARECFYEVLPESDKDFLSAQMGLATCEFHLGNYSKSK